MTGAEHPGPGLQARGCLLIRVSDATPGVQGGRPNRRQQPGASGRSRVPAGAGLPAAGTADCLLDQHP
jgi:hypothetical protein